MITSFRARKSGLFVEAFGVLCLFSWAAQCRADELVTSSGRRLEIIVQNTSPLRNYWRLGDDGRLENIPPGPGDNSKLVLAPEKSGDIRDRWRNAGLTIRIERKDGGFAEYYNCFFDWTAPRGFTIYKFGFGDYSPGRYRPTRILPTLANTNLPLRNLESIEVVGDGDYPLLAVTPKGRAKLAPDRPQARSISGMAKGDAPIKLVPSIIGYTYEAGKVDGDPFFRPHEVPLSGIRRATIINAEEPRQQQNGVEYLYQLYRDLSVGLNVEEADVRKYYDEHSNEYDRVKVRHILVGFKDSPVHSTKADLTEEQALQKANALRARLEAGEDFAGLAKAESDDTSTASKGGDLGLVGHGQLFPEFDQAVFAAAVGKVTAPVKSRVGYTLILVEKHEAKAFDEVRFEIEDKIRTERARKAVQDLQNAQSVSQRSSPANGTVSREAQKSTTATTPADPQSISQLISNLKDPDVAVRLAAAKALAPIRSTTAIEPLIIALRDPDMGVRVSAAIALEGILSEPSVFAALAPIKKNPRMVEYLLGAVKDPDGVVRSVAVKALGDFQFSGAIQPLIVALKDPDSAVRRAAAAALYMGTSYRGGTSRAIEPLIVALKDPDGAVRLQAAEALSYILSTTESGYRELALIKNPSAVGILLGALKEPNATFRAAAIQALGGMKAADAIGPVTAALRDTEPFVRADAADALAKLSASSAVEPLIVALRDPASNVRAHAEMALKEIGTTALDSLLVALKGSSDPKTRATSAQALGMIKSPRAVEPLLSALKDPIPEVRSSAASALGEIQNPRAVEPLLSALKDPDILVRKSAAQALGEINDPRAVNALLAAWKARDTELIAGAVYFFMQRHDPGSEDVLIDVFDKSADTTLAYYFLNYGTPKQRKLAQDWATAHGYRTISIPSIR